MGNEVMERYYQKISNKENNGRVEQLKYYPPYQTKSEKRKKK